VTTDLESTGDALFRARSDVRLTMVQLAAELDVTTVTVARWERGKTAPNSAARVKLVDVIARYDVEVATTLARAFDVSPPASTVIPRTEVARAAFEHAVQLGADTMDLPPRKVRAAFTQLVLQLRAAGATLDDLASLTLPPSTKKPQ
jgi:transcriptional regulator with XRE-family HTH domain